MPTAVIADDEDLQRSDLRRMLSIVWPELRIVAECEDGSDALEAIVEYQPDIAFLDIRMPDLSGLDVARATNGRCRIVFITAYDKHAIEAFSLGAVDYLLKPIQQDRLSQTVTRLRSQIDTVMSAPDLLRVMSELDRRIRDTGQTERIRWISANSGKTIQIIPVADVLFFEADTRYTRVVSATEEALVRTPIKELQRGLDPEQFWQIHRGILVNANAILRARRDEVGLIKIELRGHQEQLKVSQSHAWRFKGM
ncbi:MAG: LytTR family DNA-binding domain-containing protein [Undibacterium sp.]|nr:LytTR family DNA-binding domain-containing protein [Undibacterium sp.]